MKQLTKEQLTDLVNENCKKIAELNLNGMTEHILDSLKGSGDNCSKVITNLVVSYGAEIKKECCNILIETLYDVLYGE